MKFSDDRTVIIGGRGVCTRELQLKESREFSYPGKPLFSQMQRFNGVIPTEVILLKVLDENLGPGGEWDDEPQRVILTCQCPIHIPHGRSSGLRRA